MEKEYIVGCISARRRRCRRRRRRRSILLFYVRYTCDECVFVWRRKSRSPMCRWPTVAKYFHHGFPRQSR